MHATISFCVVLISTILVAMREGRDKIEKGSSGLAPDPVLQAKLSHLSPRLQLRASLYTIGS